MRKVGMLALFGFVLGASTVWAQSNPDRVGLALVIGNSRYAQGELPSVEIDADSMAKALESLGFRVRTIENVRRPREFEEELRLFLKAEEATAEDILVVYYSGHGVQMDGRSYFLGTGITGSADVTGIREYAVEVDSVIRMMEQAAPAARILIVDACRNSPFATTSRKAGVSYQTTIEDTYILFADEPGKAVPARSETSIQSPFTAGLLYALETSEGGIEERFTIAREKTRELNPTQNPQLLKSNMSADRSRPFLDRGARSAPTRRAVSLLEEAEEFYSARSWDAFSDKIEAAQALSSDAGLTARLEREEEFAKRVIAAQLAEKESRWADAATSWSEAGTLFPARRWVVERAAFDFLLADRIKEAATMLARLAPVSEQASQMLADLVRFDASLEGVVKVEPGRSVPAAGPEFEKYAGKS